MRIRPDRLRLGVLRRFTSVTAQEVGWTANGRDRPCHPISARIGDRRRDRRSSSKSPGLYPARPIRASSTRKPSAFEATPPRGLRTCSSARRWVAGCRARDPHRRERWVFRPRRALATSRLATFASRGGPSGWTSRPPSDAAGHQADLRRHRAVRSCSFAALDARSGIHLRGLSGATASWISRRAVRIPPFDRIRIHDSTAGGRGTGLSSRFLDRR